VAKLRATALTCVQPNFLNLTTSSEVRADNFLVDFVREPADPYGAAILRPFHFWHSPFFPSTISFKGLVFRIVHADWHAFQDGACEFRCLVHSLSLEKLDVAKMAVSELVHLQTDHLNLATRFKEVDDILLCSVDGQIAQPERVSIWRLHTFRLTA